MKKPKQTDQSWIKNLRTFMQKRGLNPRSLSLKAGLNATAVRDMLEGRTRFPRYDTVVALAKALEISPTELMAGKAEDSRKLDNNLQENEDLEILTEIIARLKEAIEDYKHSIEAKDFAAMATALYKSAKQYREMQQASPSTLKSQISALVEYDFIRKKPT